MGCRGTDDSRVGGRRVHRRREDGRSRADAPDVARGVPRDRVGGWVGQGLGCARPDPMARHARPPTGGACNPLVSAGGGATCTAPIRGHHGGHRSGWRPWTPDCHEGNAGHAAVFFTASCMMDTVPSLKKASCQPPARRFTERGGGARQRVSLCLLAYVHGPQTSWHWRGQPHRGT